MTYCVEFELQIEQDAFTILAQSAEIISQGFDTLLDGRKTKKQRNKFFHVTVDVFFEDGTKDILFVFKIGIKRATRLAGSRCDVFKACMFKPIASEDRSSGVKKFLP